MHSNKLRKTQNAPHALTFIACILFFILPLRSQAQTKENRVGQFIHRIDSLRLQLRNAADKGKMLQWADSLVRKYKKNGEIDTSLVQKLSNIDRTLFWGDSLMASKYRKTTFDTIYISRPNARWTIKLRGNLSGAKLETIDHYDGNIYTTIAKASYRGTLSVAVAYRGVALGLALNPAKLAGKSKDYEMNLNSYSNRYGFDIVYLSSKTYQGTMQIGNRLCNIPKGIINQEALNVNAYYAFNFRKFSFPAAFSQSYIQRRSAGSWLIGGSFDASHTRINEDEIVGTQNMEIHITEMAIGGGYGYNWVPATGWLFHLSSLPTFVIFSHDNVKRDQEKTDMKYHFPSVIITGRGAINYSWRNKFLGLTMVYNASVTGDEDKLQVKRDKWRLRAFWGFRF